MRKIIVTGLAAATLLGSLGLGSTASAQYRHDGYYHHHDNSGAAVAAGIAGLAVGAAIAGSQPRYYYNGGYYDRPYRYSYGPRCRSYTVWDPYAYAYVVRRRCW